MHNSVALSRLASQPEAGTMLLYKARTMQYVPIFQQISSCGMYGRTGIFFLNNFLFQVTQSGQNHHFYFGSLIYLDMLGVCQLNEK